MEVPGWHRGDLAFSFRTSSERVILLYQPLLHPKHPYFRVLLENGKIFLSLYTGAGSISTQFISLFLQKLKITN